MKSIIILLSLISVTGCSLLGENQNQEATRVEILSPEWGTVIDKNVLTVFGKCNGDFDLIMDLYIYESVCVRGRFSTDIDLNHIHTGLTNITATSRHGDLHVWRTIINSAPSSKMEFCR